LEHACRMPARTSSSLCVPVLIRSVMINMSGHRRVIATAGSQRAAENGIMF